MNDVGYALIEQRMRLQEENARLRKALEAVEWVSICGCDHAMLECPWCGMLEYSAYPSGKHEPDCARQLALKENTQP